ncbi:MAG: hypothetical protein MJ252_09555 [archaeon]|nr:hypothetical protein [archaeon]
MSEEKKPSKDILFDLLKTMLGDKLNTLEKKNDEDNKILSQLNSIKDNNLENIKKYNNVIQIAIEKKAKAAEENKKEKNDKTKKVMKKSNTQGNFLKSSADKKSSLRSKTPLTTRPNEAQPRKKVMVSSKSTINFKKKEGNTTKEKKETKEKTEKKIEIKPLTKRNSAPRLNPVPPLSARNGSKEKKKLDTSFKTNPSRNKKVSNTLEITNSKRTLNDKNKKVEGGNKIKKDGKGTKIQNNKKEIKKTKSNEEKENKTEESVKESLENETETKEEIKENPSETETILEQLKAEENKIETVKEEVPEVKEEPINEYKSKYPQTISGIIGYNIGTICKYLNKEEKYKLGKTNKEIMKGTIDLIVEDLKENQKPFEWRIEELKEVY